MNPFHDRFRLLLAVLIPIGALGVQWVLWPYIKPFVWFLFFPAVFFSARVGGLWGGLASTAQSASIVWYFFITPQLSWKLDNPPNIYSVIMFLIMGYLFSDTQERLRRAQASSDAALTEARIANEKITQLYQKTLELDELKTQFFANVSHELRTPLTLIMSPLGRRLAAQDRSEAEHREDEMMLRNARLLYRHVSDLLDAAKLEAGRMSIEYARIDIGRLARATSAQFDSVAKEKGIGYSVDIPTHLDADADAEKIQRILLNLLSNAFKFTPDGGRIDVRLRDEAGTAVMEVQDNGPGVPATMRETVFERFRQVEGGARRRFGGTGLGLAIVKQFAELHGGTAGVSEASGGGALFAVRLPLRAPNGVILQDSASQLDPVIDRQFVDELQAHGHATTIEDSGAKNAPLVLVVEDNVDMNAFIADALRPHYRVACAFDGGEGLELALATPPDLILSDVMMPRVSGDQMVEELRRHRELVDVPIVMLTAKADDELRVRLFKAGVQGYLNKPFAVEEVLARVASLLTARQRSIAELTRSEAALKEAQRLAGVGSWSWDQQTDNHFWSEEVYRIYGRDPALPPAIYPEVQSYFTPESWKQLSAAVETALALGTSYLCDAEVVRSDGSHCWITARGEVTRDAGGNVLNLHGTVQDITERKQGEEEIRRLNAGLEQRVIDRTAELLAANRELDSFAYAVSHDLRGPLRALSGFSQALIEDIGGTLRGDAKLYLNEIGIASHRMGDLIDGILALSRSTRGDLLMTNIDLSGLATRLLEELAREEPDRRMDWQVEASLNATCDERMIESVLRNLIGNAWKYTGKTQEPRIHVKSEEVGGVRSFCIVDNGAGFDMAHASQLFQPFRRLHREDEFPGIGIGLATVQRIIHRHGGEIRAESRPGAGATFCFTLPEMKSEVPS